MPKEIKNLKKASQRILKAVKNKEKIILYGDADFDGLASVVILKESIKSLGGAVDTVYFPDRQKEGYGLNNFALNYLKKKTPALLIMLDCGISNFKEVKKAKKLGFEVIIIDHHEVLEELPEVSIVVDPKQKGDKYPFKGLATSGIIFRLSQLLFGKKFSNELQQTFLELVALSTLADMMPKEYDNLVFVNKGLESLKKTFRPGLKAFWNINKGSDASLEEVCQSIISALNFSEVNNHLIEAYLLLTANDEKEAEIIAKDLIRKSQERQLRIREIFDEITERVSESNPEPIIFADSSGWETILLGSVASRICHRYDKPTFILGKGEKKSQGAVRMPKGFNGVEAMKTCAKYLFTFGGHPMAAGFSINNENLEKFRECLILYFRKI